ncbi:hypothetical protein LIER_18717 [Lithospermum erythrorhizon]|uniref:Uncharacterized protein n=1 Tax=Lithospermum erythrorhizon TaxID=34254 RepID=A0AAV3QF06_LITER
MVLGVSGHGPNAGYTQQSYDNYGNYSSSMQRTRPHSGIHSASGPIPNHYGNGNGYGNSGYSSGIPSQHGSGDPGYGNYSYSSGITSQHGSGGPGYGNSSYSSGIHSQHGSGGNGYGSHQSYGHQSNGHSSSSPYYQQQHNGSHGWISKDLDD